MQRTVRDRFAVSTGRMRRACPLAACVALGLALTASAARADSAYPPGLFENSPVVPHGYVPPESPPPAAPGDAAPGAPAPLGPESGLPPPDMGAAPGPDESLPPPGPVGPAPGIDGEAPAYRPPAGAYDAAFCASVATRAFHSLEEVRQAHARCDRASAAPPPLYPPGY